MYKVHTLKVGSNAFIIEAESTLILIDAGYPRKHKKILRKISALAPKKLVLIFLTHGHFDHYGSANAIRKFTAAQIGIHYLDADAVRKGKSPILKTKNGGTFGKALLPMAEFLYGHKGTEVDVTFKDGDSLNAYGVNARVIHTPGHTSGSCCLLVDSNIAFCGDLISTQFGIRKQQWYATDWNKIDESIIKLKNYGITRIYPGHGRRAIRLGELEQLLC